MCGIVGMVWRDPARRDFPEPLTRALESIRHRGPDGEGRLALPGIIAGMRRLAIIDLAGGDQPIFNETEDVAVLFNGEIYNYRELRRDLEARGHRFRTACDTEVLVHLYEDRGAEFLHVLDGMFGFVIWDRRNATALIARDRFGIKPLYLAETPDGLAFASETKAMAEAGWIERRLAPDALPEYFRYAWIPEPRTLWRGVRRLPPGHFVRVVDGRIEAPRPYHRHVIGGARRPRNVEAADEQLLALTKRAVQRQLVADVPVGLFLSGGLDSSLLAALAARNGADLPCHTIEFRQTDRSLDPMGDDAYHARALARELGLSLTVHTIEPHAVDLLPKLLRHMDDPAADPAIINAFLIAEAARPTTKVLLSGMGADEVAGGYRRSVAAAALDPFYRAPFRFRAEAARLARQAANTLDLSNVSRRPGLRRVKKALSHLPESVEQLPESFATWTDPALLERLGLGATAGLWPPVQSAVTVPKPIRPLEACLAFDLACYLPSHNLLYVDKATMAASVEVRVPFLDNDLATYLLALPPEEKVSGTTTKRALRRAARSVLPRSILRRSKTGFGAPIRAWLGGELKPMVHDLLAPSVVRARGLVDPDGVSYIMSLYHRDIADVSYTVWALLSLEIWCREVMDRPQGERASFEDLTACSR